MYLGRPSETNRRRTGRYLTPPVPTNVDIRTEVREGGGPSEFIFIRSDVEDRGVSCQVGT